MTKGLRAGLWVFAVAYTGIGLSGLMSVEGQDFFRILYSKPMQAWAVALFAVEASGIGGGRSGKLLWFLRAAAALAVALGIILGSLYRFSGETVITETQTVSLSGVEYLRGTYYMGKLAKKAEADVELVSLKPGFSGDGMSLESLDARLKINAQERGLGDKGAINAHGLKIGIKGFGYSPMFELGERGGEPLEQAYVYLNIFPPGAEDYFRLLEPLTYYVRYYPSGRPGFMFPHFSLRIARNKDIVASKPDLKLGEKLVFDNGYMSFIEIKPWTRLVIVRDSWMELAVLGLVLSFILAVVPAILEKRTRRST